MWIGVRSFAARLAVPALLAAFAAMTAATGCAQQLESATWRAERIKGSAVTEAAPVVRIADGHLSGTGGCNRLSGAATFTGNGIAIGSLIMTRIACEASIMAQEQAFLAALGATRSFRLEGERLMFLDAAGAETIRFVQQR